MCFNQWQIEPENALEVASIDITWYKLLAFGVLHLTNIYDKEMIHNLYAPRYTFKRFCFKKVEDTN